MPDQPWLALGTRLCVCRWPYSNYAGYTEGMSLPSESWSEGFKAQHFVDGTHIPINRVTLGEKPPIELVYSSTNGLRLVLDKLVCVICEPIQTRVDFELTHFGGRPDTHHGITSIRSHLAPKINNLHIHFTHSNSIPPCNFLKVTGFFSSADARWFHQTARSTIPVA
jgi:hypothetical protein